MKARFPSTPRKQRQIYANGSNAIKPFGITSSLNVRSCSSATMRAEEAPTRTQNHGTHITYNSLFCDCVTSNIYAVSEIVPKAPDVAKER